MANLADLTVGLGVDDKLSGPMGQAEQKVESFADKVERQSAKLVGLGDGMQNVGKKMSLFATLPIAAGFAKATDAASDLNESINAVNVTFGDAADGVLKLSENAATSVGLSQEQFNGLAVRFSAFASTVAGEGGDVVGTLDDLTVRAADFASVMNMDVNEAAQIFQSGLAGETEPLRKFGIDLSAAAVQAHAVEKGIASAGEEMSEQQKVQARYSLLMEQTNKTAGDFANTSDSVANAQRIAAARASDLAAEFGQKLLPVKAKVLELAGSLLDRFGAMSPTMKTVTVAVAGVVAAAGPLIYITGTLVKTVGRVGQAFSAAATAAPKMLSAAQTVGSASASAVSALGRWIASGAKWVASTVAQGAKAVASMAVTAGQLIAHYVRMAAAALAQAARMAASWVIAMGPVGWVIAAVVALVALIIANWDKVKEWTGKIWDWVGDKVEAVWTWVSDTTRKAVDAVVNFVTNLRDKAVALVQKIVDFIREYHPIMILWRLAQEWVPKAIQWFVSLRDRAVEMVRLLASRVVGFFGDLVVGAINFVTNLRERVVSIFTGMRDRAVDTIRNLVDRVKGIKDTVLGFFANAGRWLFDAGKKIVQGLIDGITGMVGKVGDAIGNVAGKVRNFLPFSPAKEGPLSGRGAPDLAGAKIAQMLASGMTSGIRDVAGASGALAGAAVPGVPRLASAGTLGTDGASAPVEVRVFVGDRELTDIVRTEVGGSFRQVRQAARSR